MMEESESEGTPKPDGAVAANLLRKKEPTKDKDNLMTGKILIQRIDKLLSTDIVEKFDMVKCRKLTLKEDSEPFDLEP